MTAPRYRVRELADLAGVTPRAIRFYVERGVLPRPTFRSTATTYGEEHLLRLRAIERLQREEKLGLDAIAKRLAKLSREELEALTGPLKTDAPEVNAAPPMEAKSAPSETRAEITQASPVGWKRVVLVPGLELHLRPDASPLLRRLAQEIHAQYGLDASTEPIADEAPEVPEAG